MFPTCVCLAGCPQIRPNQPGRILIAWEAVNITPTFKTGPRAFSPPAVRRPVGRRVPEKRESEVILVVSLYLLWSPAVCWGRAFAPLQVTLPAVPSRATTGGLSAIWHPMGL